MLEPCFGAHPFDETFASGDVNPTNHSRDGVIEVDIPSLQGGAKKPESSKVWIETGIQSQIERLLWLNSDNYPRGGVLLIRFMSLIGAHASISLKALRIET